MMKKKGEMMRGERDETEDKTKQGTSNETKLQYYSSSIQMRPPLAEQGTVEKKTKSKPAQRFGGY
jgi:hypothetical protein